MTTQTHTLILTTPRLNIPSNPNVIEIMNNLIHNNLVNIDYFGSELDNGIDYEDEAAEIKRKSSTFITLHFDQNANDNVDYNIEDEAILNRALNVILEKQIREVIADKNEIEIYIY